MKVAGLISGTSADAVDAALLDVGEDRDGTGPSHVDLLSYREFPLDRGLRSRVLAAASAGADTRDVALLRRDLGVAFGTALGELLRASGVEPAAVGAAGCHGQTVWHEPPGPGVGPRGTSLQLGDPAVVAARAGVPVVSDFRSADLAAGGQGAPLVPWPDQVLFGRRDSAVALLNLGGMGNVTWLPARGTGDDPVAFDTGPGNALLDDAAGRATGGGQRCDRDGRLARRGRVDRILLERLMEHPFLARTPPRSTGREVFGPAMVEELAAERDLRPGEEDGWPDLLATLARFTVESVAQAFRQWIVPRGVHRVLLTGGGAHNPVLVEGLREVLAPVPVETGPAALGMEPDAREAAAFALLAWAFLHRVPGNIPTCTGAEGPRVLGSWTPAPGRRDGTTVP